MKYVVSVLLISVLYSCSNSPEKRAQQLIKNYLMKNLDDPSSYESEDFGKLDTVKIPYSETEKATNHFLLIGEIMPEYILSQNYLGSAQKTIESYHSNPGILGREYEKKFNDNLKLAESAFAIQKVKMDSLQRINENDSIEYSRQPNWYLAMKHSYRAKNKMGAIIKNNTIFHFDHSITKIIDSTTN